MGSLLVGVSFAKGFARSLGIPMIDVNHLQGHVLAHFIRESEDDNDQPTFPYLCLLVSGGNSQIVKVNSYKDMEILGQTIDDAAGEAIDKCSKVMGLGYPGGPIIDKLARQGNADAFEFSKPDIAGYDYSFSGLKTSFLYHLRDWLKEDPDFIEHHKEDLAASLEKTIVDILMKKLQGCERHRHPPSGCGRWGECQQRTAQCFSRSCPPLSLENFYPQVFLHHRQCCHDWHHGLFQVSRQGLCFHRPACLCQSDQPKCWAVFIS